jgi:DNA-binding MurR/RpiR family transcriptional regulator
MNGCIYLIKQYLPNLAPSERKAAEYLLANPSSAVHLGVKELALEAQTSSAAVVRLANRLGYSGYSDLRMNLAQEVFSSENPSAASTIYRLTEGAPIDDIVRTLVGFTVDNIRGLEQVIDVQALDRAVEAIIGAGRIVIAGIGASGVVATDFQQKLARLGLFALYSPDSDMQVVQACSLGREDAVIAVSYSGESGDVLKVVREARKNGTAVIAITRIGGSSLSRLSDISLNVPSNESLFREGATISRISQLLVVDIIYAMILTRDQERSGTLLKRTWEAVSHMSSD